MKVIILLRRKGLPRDGVVEELNLQVSMATHEYDGIGDDGASRRQHGPLLIIRYTGSANHDYRLRRSRKGFQTNDRSDQD